ncbi:MAG: tetratricopeptide repeat protein, partial [Planctomycetota bacterium]
TDEVCREGSKDPLPLATVLRDPLPQAADISDDLVLQGEDRRGAAAWKEPAAPTPLPKASAPVKDPHFPVPASRTAPRVLATAAPAHRSRNRLPEVIGLVAGLLVLVLGVVLWQAFSGSGSKSASEPDHKDATKLAGPNAASAAPTPAAPPPVAEAPPVAAPAPPAQPPAALRPPEDPAARERYKNAMDAGWQQFRDGHFELAQEKFRLALAERPDDLAAQKASKQVEEERQAATQARYQKAFAQAQQKLNGGDFDGAEADFKATLEEKPGDAQALKGLEDAKAARLQKRIEQALAEGREKFKDGDWDAAEKSYRRALEEKPNDAEALKGVADVQAARKELSDKNCAKALAEGRKNLNDGDFKSAEANFKSALRERPNDPEALKGIADMVLARKELSDKNYAKALADGRKNLGDGDLRSAEANFKSALRERPDDSEAAKGLADVKAERDQKLAPAKARLDEAKAALDACQAGSERLKGQREEQQHLLDVLKQNRQPIKHEDREKLTSLTEACEKAVGDVKKAAAAYSAAQREFDRLKGAP